MGGSGSAVGIDLMKLLSGKVPTLNGREGVMKQRTRAIQVMDNELMTNVVAWLERASDWPLHTIWRCRRCRATNHH